MTRKEYEFFQHSEIRHHCIMGNDYYATNEHSVSAEGSVRPSGEIVGFDEIARQYHGRYKIPVMHTETNFDQGAGGDEAVRWLWKQWANVMRIRNDGIPIVGFTWYSLIDQVDWDSSLRRQAGHVNPRGLFDLQRNIRPVGTAYAELIEQWQSVLPAQSACLAVPFFLPSEYDEPLAQRRRDWVRQCRANRPKTRKGASVWPGQTSSLT
jgi:beta-glucosidase/6-phospho-beta-glucosidase/beta-galactosidase